MSLAGLYTCESAGAPRHRNGAQLPLLRAAFKRIEAEKASFLYGIDQYGERAKVRLLRSTHALAPRCEIDFLSGAGAKEPGGSSHAMFRSARWLMLTLLLALIPASIHAQAIISVGFAPPECPSTSSRTARTQPHVDARLLGLRSGPGQLLLGARRLGGGSLSRRALDASLLGLVWRPL